MSDTRSGAPNRDAGKEQVSATAMGKTGEVIDANNLKSSSVGVVRLVQVQTGGGAEVAGPWCNANARAEVETDRYSVGGMPLPGMFGASVTYLSEIYPYGVLITSDIEASFKKGANGLPEECKRKDDGSIEVHSVVTWNENYQEFLASQIFRAAISGFPDPIYNWNVGGGNILLDMDDAISVVQSFGATPANPLGATTTVTLAVTDTDPNIPALSSRYTVHWHHESENWREYGQIIKTSAEYELRGVPAGIFGSMQRYAFPNETITVAINPLQGFLEYQDRLVMGTYVIASTTLCVYIPQPAQTIAVAAAAAAGFQIADRVVDAETKDFTNTHDKWREAVAKTQASTSLSEEYVYPPEFVAGYTPSANPDADLKWKACGMAVNRKVNYEGQPLEGDGYNHNGYSGRVVGKAEVAVKEDFIFYFYQGVQRNEP